MFCKVMIVDDEYIMRQGIRHMIEWEKEGYQLVAEAANWEEVLAMIEEHKPDIVLADIVMPVLDGMDFSVIVKKRFPQVRLIILSSYDDFEYVKKTLLSGACDYVLKPSLNPQELLGVLGRTAAMIPGMYLEKKLELSVTEKLSRYLNGYEANFTEGDFRHRFPYSKCRLLLSKDCIGQEGRLEDGTELVRFVRDYWKEQKNYETEVIFAGGEACAVILNYRVCDEEQIRGQAEQCVRKTACYRPGSFWVYGAVFEGMAGLLDSYRQGCGLLELKFYYKDTPFLSAAQARKHKKLERFNYEQYAELLKYRNYKEALQQLEAYIAYMCSCTAEEYLLKNTAKNLIYNFLLEKEKAGGGMKASKSDFFRKIDQSRYVQDFRQQFGQVVKELEQECEGSGQAHDSLHEIKQYIQKHYAQDLELAKIAKEFNYNYNYLSTYFNRKVGESFSEYVNRIRIEKACEILKSSSCTIAQVSEMTGYSDPSYFSRIFKNQTGKTPSQWKRRLGKTDGMAE